MSTALAIRPPASIEVTDAPTYLAATALSLGTALADGLPCNCGDIATRELWNTSARANEAHFIGLRCDDCLPETTTVVVGTIVID